MMNSQVYYRAHNYDECHELHLYQSMEYITVDHTTALTNARSISVITICV